LHFARDAGSALLTPGGKGERARTRTRTGAEWWDDFLYQVIAKGNLDNDPDLDAWVLTRKMDDTVELQRGCILGGTGPVTLDRAD